MNEYDKRDLYPHVSDIIDVHTYRSYAITPLNQLVAGSVRGVLVHDQCTAYAQNVPVIPLNETYGPYITAFINWYIGNQAILIKAKERLYDDEYLFSGEPDLIVQLNGSEKKSPVEIKTGSKFLKSWVTQLAAYFRLCEINGIEVEVAYILHLKKIYKKKKTTIRAEAIPFTKEDLKYPWEIFKGSLFCYDYYYREEDLKKLMEEYA